MSIKEKLTADLKESLKSGDKVKLSVVRMVLSSIKNKEIDKRAELSEEEVLAVLSHAAKLRRESIEEFTKGRREDLVQKEREELKVVENYLPEQLSEDKLKEIAKEAILEASATSTKDIGKVMKILMPRLKGQADGKIVNKIVQQALENQI